MIRRNFLRIIAAAGAGSVSIVGLAAAGEKRAVSYHVEGFTCNTCALGLDTMLTRLHGVMHSHSSYPDGAVNIDFHPHLVSEETLKQCIRDAGFTVA